MKNFDNLKLPELLEEIVRLRAETEAIEFETQAIKKHGEEAHNQRLSEIDAIRKETEAIRKETEAIRKETEVLEKKVKEELLALEKKGKEELHALKKESEKVDQKLKSTMDRYELIEGKGVKTMFFNSILINPTLSKIHFDFVNTKVKFFKESGAIATKIDFVLVNKNSVGLVEIKDCFKTEDLENFLTRIYPMFKKYGGNVLRTHTYLFIAALSYDDNVISLAKAKGVGILHLKNDLIEVEGKLVNY